MNVRMTYEALIRKAFDSCGRGDDPLGLADANLVLSYKPQNLEANDIHLEYDHRWMVGISAALKKVKRDRDASDLAHKLGELDTRLWKCTKCDEAMNILEEAIQLFDEHDIGFPSSVLVM